MQNTNETLWRSYTRALRARNRSETTVRRYGVAIMELDRHAGRDLADLDRAAIQDYLTTRLAEVSPTTVAINFRSLRAMYHWMESEEIIDRSPMRGLQGPRVPDNPPAVLDDADLKALLAACAGKGFENRRDEAIIRVFCETGGPRLAEVAGMTLDSLDLTHDLFQVTGKGSKTRLIPFGAKTGTAIDRYLRLRNKHPRRESRALWLGRKGPLTPSAFAQMLERRAAQAGWPRIHPHQLRHTSAHRWLSAGGSETDAMMLFGWTSADMPRRYGRAARVPRAQIASRRQSLGDRL